MTPKTFILVTAIIELLAGAALFIMPTVVPEMAGDSPMAFTFSRMYGAAALTLGYYAIMVWKNYGAGPVQGFLKTFIVFHVGVAVAAYTGYNAGLESFIGVCTLHLVMALLTLFYFVQGKNEKIKA